MTDKILIVEDDAAIAEMVANYLTMEGLEITHAYDGEEALSRFKQQPFDLILLDLMLPKLSGIDLLKQFRAASRVPILILSAKDGDVDKAVGLGFGADDYIAKPFSMIELLARIKAALRRASYYSDGGSQSPSAEIVRIHDLTINPDHLTVSKNGKALKLTAKELHILLLFVRNPKKVFTKEQIYRSVWHDDYFGDENIINVHMSRLREKIEDVPSKPIYIKTMWGIGYRLGEF
ncbi:DNA-binding response regulator [Paenibacillaceae bacterium]|nr:DNA-binding response regulator [Paenibacillaceae bacterium]